jgi:hypothetical protein
MRFVCLFFFLLSLPAFGAESCYDSRPVVDIQADWDFTAAPQADFYLPTRTVYGGYLTWAAAHLRWDGRLETMFDFQPPQKEALSLPYTVYRLQLQVGKDGDSDGFLYDNDLTRNCTGPGRSLFPGDVLRLPAVQVPSHKDGTPRGLEPLRIRIWGKHS